MRRLRTYREDRRGGRAAIPAQPQLTEKYAIQTRAQKTLEDIVAHETQVIVECDDLGREGVVETKDLQDELQTVQPQYRLSAQIYIDRHIAMSADLLRRIHAVEVRKSNHVSEIDTFEELPTEKFMRLYDLSHALAQSCYDFVGERVGRSAAHATRLQRDTTVRIDDIANIRTDMRNIVAERAQRRSGARDPAPPASLYHEYQLQLLATRALQLLISVERAETELTLH